LAFSGQLSAGQGQKKERMGRMNYLLADSLSLRAESLRYFLKRSSSFFLASSLSPAEDEGRPSKNTKKSQKFALSLVLWNSAFGSRHLLWEDSEKNLQFRQI
jgi:hypothetical protein